MSTSQQRQQPQQQQPQQRQQPQQQQPQQQQPQQQQPQPQQQSQQQQQQQQQQQSSQTKKIDPTAMLKSKTLEDIINDWSSQLEESVELFTKQALQVAEWDQKIIENNSKIINVFENVKKIQTAQKELDQTLELIYTQQQELSQVLDVLENEVEKLIQTQATSEKTPPDVEREKGYQMAEDINKQLDQMETTLKDLVKKINMTQEQEAGNDDPMYQIVQILNTHLTSLQWIDQTSLQVQQKILDLEKQLKLARDDQENLARARRRENME